MQLTVFLCQQLFVTVLLLHHTAAAVGVDRQGLAAFLVNEASTRHPQGITFHWNAQPAAFDLQAKTLTCQVGSSGSSTPQGGAGRCVMLVTGSLTQAHELTGCGTMLFMNMCPCQCCLIDGAADLL